MFDLKSALFAFVTITIIILVARWLKAKIRLFQDLYLPESIIAGAIALILGPGVLGAIAVARGAGGFIP